MRIRHYLYNAFVITDDDLKLAIDPGRNLRLSKLGSLIPRSEWDGTTHVLVTHGDPDHFPHAVPMALETGARVVCGNDLVEEFTSQGVQRVRGLEVGEKAVVDGLQIEALRATHGPLHVEFLAGLAEMTNQLAEGDRSSQDVYVGPLRVHHKEETEAVHDHGSISLLNGLVRLEKDNVGFAVGAIGFRLMLGGHTVVNLGDTLLHEEWAGLEPDVLMVPIGGRIAHNTMNEVQALEAVRMIAPKLVIPCHYDGAFLWRKNVNPADERFFKREVVGMGIPCQVMAYGEEIAV